MALYTGLTQHMRKLFFITIVSCFFSFCVQAQTEKNYDYIDTVKTIVEYTPDEEKPAVKDEYTTKQYQQTYIDTSLYFHKLNNDADTINAYKTAKAFAYVNYLDSLLAKEQAKKAKEKKETEPTYNNDNNWINKLFAAKGFQYFLWFLAIGFVLFILYKLFFTQGLFQRATSKAATVENVVEEEEINAQSNFDALIQNAEQTKNYRLAVRYQYLKSLHHLAQKNIVQLAADKTNYNYVQEIKMADVRNTFASLTLNYEYAWYGEFEIDAVLYSRLQPSFKNFNATIS